MEEKRKAVLTKEKKIHSAQDSMRMSHKVF